MTKNYKILTSYVKDISSKISGTEDYIYLKDNIPKYSLGIDINSAPFICKSLPGIGTEENLDLIKPNVSLHRANVYCFIHCLAIEFKVL